MREESRKMLLGLFSLAFLFLAEARAPLDNAKRSVCASSECKEFAGQIILNMNSSVDPCTNFYEYVCGNWVKRNPLPAGKQVWKVLMIAEEANKQKIEELLKAATQHDEIPPVRSVKAWYKACTDTESMEKRRMQPFLPILSGSGGWPMIMQQDQSEDSRYEWQTIDDYFARLRASNFLHEVRVAAYGRNATGLSVVLDVPDLPVATWLLNSDVDEAADVDSNSVSSEEDMITTRKKMNKNGMYWKFLLKIVTAIAEATNQSLSAEKLEQDMEDLLNFQWKLAQLTYDIGDYVNMTASEFQQWYDDLRPLTKNAKINWADKIIGMFKEAEVDIDTHTNIKVAAPQYFRNVVPLLDATPARTIVNYIHWNFVSHNIAKTTSEMRKLYMETTAPGDDEADQVSRSEQCIAEAQMNDIISYEYIRKYFSNDTLHMVMDALDDIAKEIELQIGASNWANKEIKDLALRKLRTLKRHIGYPSWYNNETIMHNFLNGLSLGPNYFENSLNLRKYYNFKTMRTLVHEDAAKPWIVDPMTINAFYLNEDNSITVPAANLQKPFFSHEQPNTMNYGLVGYLVAHEMNHGYDAQRHIYDEQGKEIEWPADMADKYNTSIQCFIQQIDNYTLDGTPDGPKIKGYGNQTLEETMSDTMGLRAAFKAYKRRESMNGKPESALPGLEEFTNDQLFFLSFGNLWCEVIDPEYLPILPKFDMHGTGRMRAMSSLSNNEDFARTFNCPLGSPMNPQKKCSTWNLYSANQGSTTHSPHYRVYQV